MTLHLQYTTQKGSATFLESGLEKTYLYRMKTYQLNGTIFYCPVDLTLSVIGGRWKGLIIWTLRQEELLRYNEIKRRLVTINDKMLSQTLKQLVEQNIIIRKSYNEIPPKVEYSLSETGKQLLPIFELMQEWGENNNYESTPKSIN